jgi:hypothetical protein
LQKPRPTVEARLYDGWAAAPVSSFFRPVPLKRRFALSAVQRPVRTLPARRATAPSF